MLFALVLPVLVLVALVHRYVWIYAPSNVLTRRVRTSPPSLRRAAGLLLLALVLLFVMHALAEAVASGAPAWLNLAVLFLAWDAIKLGVLSTMEASRAMRVAVSRTRGSRHVKQASEVGFDRLRHPFRTPLDAASPAGDRRIG